MARITLTKETTVKDEQSIMYATRELTNYRTTEYNDMEKRPLAAYLSIPEMALEWIVEPG
jgi:hypothetical protein